MAILETSHCFIYFINEKKILISFTNGRGNLTLGNMLEFLFFPSKMFN